MYKSICHCLLGTPSGALASYSSGGGYSSSLSLSQGGGTCPLFLILNGFFFPTSLLSVQSWPVYGCCAVQTGAISPLSAAAAAAAAAGRVALSGSGVSGVLLASNLNEEVYKPKHNCKSFTVIPALSQ